MKVLTSLLLILLISTPALGQVIDASTLLPRVSITFSPASGTFTEGSTFEVPITLNTNGLSVNTIEVRVYFDSSKLSIVQPSSDRSIIGLWLEPPSYDNTNGTARYVGSIPNGIVTSSGVIGTITFKAKATGSAVVSLRSDSEALLNDGLGSPARIDAGRGVYSIVPKPPEGLSIFSETHPSQATWYNNPNPVFTWEKAPDVTAFSYVLDSMPNTIPPSIEQTGETVKSYQDLEDGLWYFHVKAYRNGVWGATGHYLVRIDTTPPAAFKPEVNYLLAAAVVVDRALVSFFTTDGLSGIARYEVGVIDKAEPATASPVFVESESPFQVPASSAGGSRVIVRAIDNAGNIRDASVNVSPPLLLGRLIEDYGGYILLGIVILMLLGSLIHYLYGHHVIRHIKRAWALIKREEEEEQAEIKAVEEKHDTIDEKP
ncbi:cohesin domain-containing protein [Patescibacteria group bacterium]|nr:cohesin domain-containing protein [Patescibacteria group bacterium]